MKVKNENRIIYFLIILALIVFLCIFFFLKEKDIYISKVDNIDNNTNENISNSIPTEYISITENKQYNGIYFDLNVLDFNNLGYEYGDSFNIYFDNGYELKDIPYYNRFYYDMKTPVLAGKSGLKLSLTKANGESLLSNFSLNNKAKITLNEKGKYLNNQKVLDMQYSTNRSDFESDEIFANFRKLKGGNIKDNIFRGASPTNNTYNRAETVNSLLKKNNINYVINLTNLSIDYNTKAFAQSMAKALIQITKNEGPYYIHCTHGRDRTGMACIILEALAGASYKEILDDYMLTYDYFYNINENTDPIMYSTILNGKFQDAIYYITREEKIDDFTTYDYKKAAEEYLKFGGLSQEEIDELISNITL